MDTIRLEGEELAFWTSHSDYLRTMAELSEEPGVLVLKRSEKPLHTDIRFDFLADIVNDNPVVTSANKDGTLNLAPGYNRNQIKEFVDFIGYDRFEPNPMLNFKQDVLVPMAPSLSLPHGTNKPRRQTRRRRRRGGRLRKRTRKTG